MGSPGPLPVPEVLPADGSPPSPSAVILRCKSCLAQGATCSLESPMTVNARFKGLALLPHSRQTPRAILAAAPPPVTTHQHTSHKQTSAAQSQPPREADLGPRARVATVQMTWKKGAWCPGSPKERLDVGRFENEQELTMWTRWGGRGRSSHGRDHKDDHER